MKKILLTVLLTALAFVFISCSTTVNVKTLVPADVNIGGQNTVIAVSGTAPFSSSAKYSVFSDAAFYSDSTAAYAGKIIEKALNQGMYRIIGVKNTDGIINSSRTLFANPTENLLKAGATIYVQSAIEYMECYDIYNEEYRTNSKTKKKELYVTVDTFASLTMSFTVWDLRTQKILDSFTLNGDKRSNTGDSYKYTGSSGIEKYPFYSKANVELLYESILDGFVNKIRNRLVPHYETVSIDLLEDKTKNKELEVAYQYARDGELRKSYSMFIEDWKRNRNTSSGCNAAILLYSLGDVEAALGIAREVYDASGSTNAYSIMMDLEDLFATEQKAMRQIEGASDAPSGATIKYW